MVDIKELQKVAEPEAPYVSEKPTLLRKYDIPVHHLDYEYIEKCKDTKELERIILILRSGEEGFYPKLLERTEEILSQLKPHSRVLRKVTPVITKDLLDKKEQAELTNELNEWLEDVQKENEELESCKRLRSIKYVPDVRTMRKGCSSKEKKPNTERIKSTDYESWNKYDVDTELIKMDLEEEKIKQKALKQEENQKEKKTINKEKKVRISEFSSKTEAMYEANREREKGNEFFKSQEYKEALEHYTNSIQCYPTAAGYTNRAITYIKLKKHEKAIEDCRLALKYEPENLKALLRLGLSYEGLKKYEEAFQYAEKVINIDPNNTTAQELSNRLRKVCGNEVRNNTRMKIIEIDNKKSMNLKLKESNKDINAKNINVKENTKKENINCKENLNVLNNINNEEFIINGEIEKIKENNKNQTLKKFVESKKNEINKSSSLVKKSILKKTPQRIDKIVPIPGTSNMPPPYYLIVKSEDLNDINLMKKAVNSRQRILCMPTIDMDSEDEEESLISIQQRPKKPIIPISKKLYKKKSKIVYQDQMKTQKFKEDTKGENKMSENVIREKQEVKIKREKQKKESENIKNERENKKIIKKSYENDRGASGEPYKTPLLPDMVTPQELHSPFTFLKTWNSIGRDTSYTQHAEVLRNLDTNRIAEGIF